jgi:hypothetical protein
MSSGETYWSKNVDLTPGTTTPKPQPYFILPGTPGGSAEEIYDQARQVYDYTMEAPPYDEDLDAETFMKWHSEQQKAYVKERLGEDTQFRIGDDLNAIHVIYSSDSDKLYVLDFLEKRDISLMSKTDQVLVAETDTWINAVSVALNMEPTVGIDADAAWEQIEEIIETLQFALDGPEAYAIGLFHDGGDPDYNGAIEFDDAFNTEPYQIQLDILKEQLEDQGIYSLTNIKETVANLTTRFERALAFFDVQTPVIEGGKTLGYIYNQDLPVLVNGDTSENFNHGSAITIDGITYQIDDDRAALHNIIDGTIAATNGDGDIIYLLRDESDNSPPVDRHDIVSQLFEENPKYHNVISLDYNTKINQGYETFIEEEARIAALMQAMHDLSTSGTLNGKSLDAPTTMAMMTFYLSLVYEAQVAMDTEEVEQNNRYLQDISIMQDINSRTLQGFDSTDTDEELAILGESGRDTANISDQDMLAIAMFTEGLANQRHPLEKLNSKPRPLLQIINNNYDPDDDENSFEFVEFVVGVTNQGSPIYDDTIIFEDFARAEIEPVNGEGDEILPWTWRAKEKVDWDQDATRISEHITIVDQQIQLKTTDINNRVKEQNRFFEMSSQELEKIGTLGARFHYGA